MGLYYRALGVVATANHVLGSIRLYHVPLNWLALASLVWVFAAGVARLGEPAAGGPFGDHPASAMATVGLSLCGLILFAVCIWQENLIFRSTATWTDGAAGASGHGPDAETIDLRATGRFHRGVGDAFWLRDFPVAWDVSDSGTVSLVTRVVDEGGIPELFSQSADRTGRWSIILSRELLTGDVDDGLLYFGLSARPAMRFRVLGEPKTVVLSLGAASELMAFRRQVDEVLAESARKQSAFAAQVEAIASAPDAAPGVSPGPAEVRSAVGERKAGREIDWENLIDFSR